MVIWDFMDYVSPAGVNLIEKWIRKDLSVQEESDLAALLAILQKQKVWGNEKDYQTLSGKKYQGLGEIRLPGDENVPMRLIGFRNPDITKFQFTFLIGAFHKGRIYDPPGALDTAVDRKKHLDNGRATTCEHGFKTGQEAGEE